MVVVSVIVMLLDRKMTGLTASAESHNVTAVQWLYSQRSWDQIFLNRTNFFRNFFVSNMLCYNASQPFSSQSDPSMYS